jgi:colanic acid/amylovoran biosynthesis glycosyltransferase
MPKRILAILDTYPALSETFLYNTLGNLTKAGFEISVRARRRGSSPHLTPFKDVKYLPSEQLSFLSKMVLLVWYALRLLVISPRAFLRAASYLRLKPVGIRERALVAFRIFPLLVEKADTVYFSFGGLAVKYLEYIELNPRVVFSLRGSDINIEPLLGEEYARRLKSAIHAAQRVHCVCEDIRHKAIVMSGEAEGKFSVIFTAVHPLFLETLCTTSSASGQPIRIISVGRLDWKKGFEHGMMAVRELTNRGVCCTWNIVGDGPYRTCLAWAIRDLGLEKYVTLVGSKSQGELHRMLCNSDVFFHPSVSEGLSNSVLEAMAVGLPVVVTDVGGMSETVCNGVTGLLVKSRDWRAMATALESLADPSLRQHIGSRGRHHVKSTFTAECQTSGFRELFGIPG